MSSSDFLVGASRSGVGHDSVDLFLGLSRLKPSDQALLAALLKEMHVVNMLAGAKAFEKRVAEARSHFELLSSESRCAFIKDQIATRTGCPATASTAHISWTWLTRVASKQSISVNRPAAAIAREVGEVFVKKMDRQIKEQMAKATPAERRKMNEALDREFAKLSQEERTALKTGLKIDALTGETVSKALMTGGALAGLATANAAGFAAYMALSTAIHFVFTTVLGMTLPFAAYTFASSALALVLSWAAPILVAVAVSKATAIERQMNDDLLEMVCALAALALPESRVQRGDAPPELPAWASEQIRKIAHEMRLIADEQRRIEGLTKRIEGHEENRHRAAAHRLAAEKRATLAIAALPDEKPVQLPSSPTGVSEEDLRAALEIAEQEEARRIAEADRHRREKDRLQEEADRLRLEAEAAEARCDQERHEKERAQEALNKRIGRVRQHLVNVCKVWMPTVTFGKRVIDWLVDHMDIGLAETALGAIQKLVQGNAGNADHGKMDSGHRHIEFGDAYRIYYTNQGGLSVVLIGHKNTQKSDANWLRSRPVQ